MAWIRRERATDGLGPIGPDGERTWIGGHSNSTGRLLRTHYAVLISAGGPPWTVVGMCGHTQVLASQITGDGITNACEICQALAAREQERD